MIRDAPSARPRGDGGGTIFILFVTMLVAYTDRGALGVLVEPIRAELNISDTQIGALQGVGFALVYAIAALPLGRLADLICARRMLIAAVAVWSVATAACALASTYQQLFAARMLVAVGEASLVPATMVLIATHLPAQRRGVAIGICAVGALLGAGLAFLLVGALYGWLNGPAAAPALLARLAAWRGSLLILGTLAIPTIFLLRRLPRQAAASAQITAPRVSWKTALQALIERRHLLVPLYAGSALISVFDGVLSTWAPALLSRRFSLSVAEAGTYLGVVSIVFGIGGALLGGLISDRVAAKRADVARARLAAVATLIAALSTLFGSSPSLPWAITLLALAMLCAYMAMTLVLTLQQDVLPSSSRGIGTSINAFVCVAIGVSGGAVLPGVLADRSFTGTSAIGIAVTCVALPSMLLAATSFWWAARAVRNPLQIAERPS